MHAHTGTLPSSSSAELHHSLNVNRLLQFLSITNSSISSASFDRLLTEASYEYVISLKAFNNYGEGRPVYENIQTKDETSGSLMYNYRNTKQVI